MAKEKLEKTNAMRILIKKIIISIIYSIVSVFWLFLSTLFVSAIWLESTGTKEWSEDAMFIPIGIIMFIIWVISLIALIYSFKNKNDSIGTDSDS
ncbi:MAG: hypothetical protein IJY74_03545 [Oscillospiraceae bacterium]|nr:hypothetical protein [Oscillospiraceae bacterium]